MNFTVWEKNLINNLLKGLTHSEFSKVEMILELRPVFELNEDQKKIFEKRTATEPKELHEKTEDIKLTVSQVAFIHNEITSGEHGVPVRKETVDLVKKLKKIIEGKNEV